MIATMQANETMPALEFHHSDGVREVSTCRRDSNENKNSQYAQERYRGFGQRLYRQLCRSDSEDISAAPHGSSPEMYAPDTHRTHSAPLVGPSHVSFEANRLSKNDHQVPVRGALLAGRYSSSASGTSSYGAFYDQRTSLGLTSDVNPSYFAPSITQGDEQQLSNGSRQFVGKDGGDHRQLFGNSTSFYYNSKGNVITENDNDEVNGIQFRNGLPDSIELEEQTKSNSGEESHGTWRRSSNNGEFSNDARVYDNEYPEKIPNSKSHDWQIEISDQVKILKGTLNQNNITTVSINNNAGHRHHTDRYSGVQNDVYFNGSNARTSPQYHVSQPQSPEKHSSASRSPSSFTSTSKQLQTCPEERNSKRNSSMNESPYQTLPADGDDSLSIPYGEHKNSSNPAPHLQSVADGDQTVQDFKLINQPQQLHLDGERPLFIAEHVSVADESRDRGASPQAHVSQIAAVASDGERALTEAGGQEVFYCHLCTFSGTNKLEFEKHMSEHFEHRCAHCDYTSRTEGRLKKHIKDLHQKIEDTPTKQGPGRPKILRCHQCDFLAKTKVEFWQHARSHIKEDKMLQCPECPFVTEYKHHLEYHLRNHIGSKPYKCNKCNYSCVNKSMLNSHMKSHTNVYQYRCADCTYATKYCHSLKLHLQKYFHKPAVVLNPDGSLPREGSGDFDSIAKRGPHRGPPRDPRGRDEDLLEQPLMPGDLLARQKLAAAIGGGNFMLDGFGNMAAPVGAVTSNFWPFYGAGSQADVGLSAGSLPTDGLSIAATKGALKQLPAIFSSPPSQVRYHHHQHQSNNEHLRCNLCEFMAESGQFLLQHLMEVHAAENEDLCRLYGVSADSFVNQSPVLPVDVPNPTTTAAMSGRNGEYTTPPMKYDFGGETLAASKYTSSPVRNEYASISMPAKVSSLLLAASAIEAIGGQMSMAEIDDQRSTIVAHSRRDDEDQSKLEEYPLDLTKPHDDLKHKFAPEFQSFSQPVNGENREGRSENQLGREEFFYAPRDRSPSDCSDSSLPPRKRSRKGKAYKLDFNYTVSQSDDQSNSQRLGELQSSDEKTYYLKKPVDESGMTLHHYRKTLVEGQEKSRRELPPDNNDLLHGDNVNQSSSVLDSIDLDQMRDKLDELSRSPPERHYSMSSEKRFSIQANAGLSSMKTNDINSSNSRYDNHHHQHGNITSWSPKSAGGGDIEMSDDSSEHLSARKSSESKDSRRNSLTGCSNPSAGGSLGGDYFECQHCDIFFRDYIMYTMHKGYHGYQNPFSCNMCGHQASNGVEFFLHIARAAHE